MNIANKFQHAQLQGQPQSNLQTQQILLQQLHQGQSQQQQQQQQQPPPPQQQQQQPSAGVLGSAFQPGDSFGEGLGQSIYQNNYQRNQPSSLQQQQFFPQFQQSQQGQQGQQQQANNNGLQLQQPYQQSQQVPRQPAHLQPQLQQQTQQQFYTPQQAAVLQVQQQQQQQQIQLQALQQPSLMQMNSISVENPNSVYWQHQQQLCQISRSANVPHYYARQYASNSRKIKNPYNDVKSVGLVEATKTMISSLEEEEKKKKAAFFQGTPTTASALLHNKKSSQDALDDDSMEEQRMRLKTQGRQLWCQLDLSGQGLVNISLKLFHYDFLESLYLNNNKLTTIPPAIRKLRSLRTLDLSHNRINELPEELGLCFNLRYLYLFDNNIKTLPYSFGNLIELLFIGIEGNPLDAKFANLIAEKGTKELICTLRDQTTITRTPGPRPWLSLEDDGEVGDSTETFKAEPVSSDCFTVLSYNTLCQHYATPKMYKFTPSWALNWEYRRSALEKEILDYSTDIICLQEVETRTFNEFWLPLMTSKGYRGHFYSKTRSKTMQDSESKKKVDGCATFYRGEKFALSNKQNFEYASAWLGNDKYKKTEDAFNRYVNKDNIALILFLQHKETGENIAVVNTHLHWDPAFNDVKTLQVGILLEEIQTTLKRQHPGEDIKNASMIVCGDLNSVKDSAVYQLFSTGSSKDHEDLSDRDFGKFTEEGFHHPFKLKSAYETVGELPFTNMTPGFTDNIDYIWYSTPTLQVKGLLGKVDEEYTSHCIGFPDANFPSDHVPILAKFQVNKGSSKKPDFKPDFKTGPSRKT
ncbi:Glucose-repressible alcohol dehydrogenase transcriptional effector [Candida viswanathii]|uniref:CCR4-Not complex 3'-5'-exoribonuclease subunit Ccr4 n=1 Tax=Candida viswanathii TaxID=5486 RepID=A0A367YF47_9ASCO|nr:Glucose-repressible alcohol dehydrogenase transcriptional effector [Candida viswanathii]